jgi:hypothetical protein
MYSWDSAITVATILVTVHLLLRLLARQGRMPSGRLAYGPALKAFAVLICLAGPLLLLVVVAILKHPLRPNDWPALASIVALFGFIGGGLALEVFRVGAAFDEFGIEFASPWSPRRRIEWSAVSSLRWQPSARLLDLLGPAGVRPIHINPMLSGLDAFARTALERVAPEVLVQSPPARGALLLMRDGKSATLFTSMGTSAALAGLSNARNA